MDSDESVWHRLRQVVADVPGWSPVEELFSLYHLALASSPLGGDILEIGSWCGRSTIALAFACKQTQQRRVIACDLFPERDDWRQNADGTWSFRVQIAGREFGAYESQTVWREPYERDVAPLYASGSSLLDIFWSNVVRYQCEQVVDAVRGDSTILCTDLAPHRRFGLVFVDGDHSYDVVRQDIKNVEPYLLRGGWLAFDDAFTSYDGVDRAIDDCVRGSADYADGTQFTRKMYAARRVV